MNTRQVMKISGATARQLQWWDEWGFVKPTIYNHERYFTAAQTTACMVIMDLKRKGIKLCKTKDAIAVVTSEEHVEYLVVDEKGRAKGAFDLQEAAKLGAAHRGPVCILPVRRHFDNGTIPTLKKFLPKQRRLRRGPKLPTGEPRPAGSLTKFERHMTNVALGTRSASFPGPHSQDYITERDIRPGREQEAILIRKALETRAKMSIDGM